MRTDIHRPSAIKPNPRITNLWPCTISGARKLDIDEVFANREAFETINRHREMTGGRYSQHEHGGTCHICGACAMYLAVYYHRATNTYIQTGEDCAQKMDMGNVEDFMPLRRAMANARAAHAGKMRAAAILGDLGLSRAWELYTTDDTADLIAAGAMIDRYPGSQWEDLPAETRDVVCRYCNTREYDTLLDMVSKMVRYGDL